MDSRYLFRGVSVRFHSANGGLLMPKAQGPFTYNFHWDEPGFAWDSGVTWDSTATNAVIRHQWNQEGFPTSGISTTPHLERAIVYARGKEGTSECYVYRIRSRRSGSARSNGVCGGAALFAKHPGGRRSYSGGARCRSLAGSAGHSAYSRCSVGRMKLSNFSPNADAREAPCASQHRTARAGWL